MKFDINNYLERKGEMFVFVGEAMSIYIPMTYQKYGLLSITDTVNALGVFDIDIKGEPSHGLFLPAVLTMQPSNTAFVTVKGVDYCKCTFTKGDIFILKNKVVQDAHLAYVMFVEYVQYARMPQFMSYDLCAFIFDIIKKVTTSKLDVNHAVFEMLFAHLARDKNNIKVPYRKTDMTEPPRFVKLDDAANATLSTTAKLTGGYFQDAINGAIASPNEETSSDIEDLLRQ